MRFVSRSGLGVCVLGGTGFVGTELVTRLAGDGHRVRVITRNPARAQHLRVLPTVEVRVANVHAPGKLSQAFEGMDAVVNLVGILNERGRSGAGFREAHAELARKVVEAARSRRVPRLLHMSSLGADAERGPSHYLRSKGEAERRVREAGNALDYAIFRPSVVFGPRDSLTNRFAALLRLSGGFLPLARARTRFAPVYVGDVALAFAHALVGSAPARRAFELCGPEVMTLEEIVRRTAHHARLPCRIVRLPDPLARLQAFVMDFVPGKPFSTDNFRSLTQDSLCTDDGFASLGIEPTPMGVVLPEYLGPTTEAARFDRLRRVARR